MLDANLEGQDHLFRHCTPGPDSWSRRAHRDTAANLDAIKSPQLYRNFARYSRAVSDLNRVMTMSGVPHDLKLGLANYQDQALSPLESVDLIRAASQYNANIFYDYFAPRLTEIIAESSPVLIGLSLNYLSQALPSFAMLGFLKNLFPQIPLIAGGGLITTWLRNPTWHNPFGDLLDQLIAGPGDTALLGLLAQQRRTGHNSRPTLTSCSREPTPAATATTIEPGLPAMQIGAPELLDSCPDYAGLPLSEYLAPGLVLPYAASSGCYWQKCSFCPEKAEHNPYRTLAPAVVLQHIRQLKKTTKPTLLHFLDNAISTSLMRALIATPPGLDWYSFARIGPELTNPQFCLDLRHSGCIMLKLGLESGDQQVLDEMGKGIDLGQVAKALTNLEKAGIATYVYLLFGTPTESLTEARRTLDFTARHSSAITFLNLAIFNMPLATPDAAHLAASNFSGADLSLYTDFNHPRGWNRPEIRRFLDREFKRHPAIVPILQRDPPQFSSNHAPFFCRNTPRPPFISPGCNRDE